MAARAAHSLVTRLWAGWSGVLFLTGERNFSLSQNNQTKFGTHQVSSCAMGTVDLCPGKGGKAMMPTAQAPTKAKVQNEWTCISTPCIHLHGMQRHNFEFTLTDSTTSRTHTVLALQPQTVYVSWPTSGIHNLLYSVEYITIIWFPTSQLSSHSYFSYYPCA
jgi:hypothetical protein